MLKKFIIEFSSEEWQYVNNSCIGKKRKKLRADFSDKLSSKLQNNENLKCFFKCTYVTVYLFVFLSYKKIIFKYKLVF